MELHKKDTIGKRCPSCPNGWLEIVEDEEGNEIWACDECQYTEVIIRKLYKR